MLRPSLDSERYLLLLRSSPKYGYESGFGMRSSDVTLRTDNLTTLYSLIEESYAKSNIFGDWLPFLLLSYAQWPFKAKSAYTGDFSDIKACNPLLFVGSRFDAFTPLVSAHTASAGFVGSVVLEHGGYGVKSPHSWLPHKGKLTKRCSS